MRRGVPADAARMRAQMAAGLATYLDFAPAGWDPAPVAEAARIEATLADPEAVVLITHGGHVAWRPHEGRAHLLALFIDTDRIGSGLARDLLDAAVETMRERGFAEASLITPAGNARARRFYEREGWHLHGEPRFADAFGLEMVMYRRDL